MSMAMDPAPSDVEDGMYGTAYGNWVENSILRTKMRSLKLDGQLQEIKIEVLEDKLQRLQDWSDALSAAGVDNWEGFSIAIAIYEQMREDFNS